MNIAFDASANPGPATSWSHTCSGVNKILFVSAHAGAGEGDTVTGATYNGVAMTLASKVLNSGWGVYVYLFYLKNPASGTNTVTLQTSGGSFWKGQSVSYTGAMQTGGIDASGTMNTTGANPPISVTTVANNCWWVVVGTSQHDSVTGVSSGTIRVANTNEQFMADSNGAISPPALTSVTLQGANDNWGGVMASFAPS